MPRESKPKPDDPEQFKRFIDMAREVEADESPGALDRAFNSVIRRLSAPNPSGRQKQAPNKRAGEQ